MTKMMMKILMIKLMRHLKKLLNQTNLNKEDSLEVKLLNKINLNNNKEETNPNTKVEINLKTKTKTTKTDHKDIINKTIIKAENPTSTTTTKEVNITEENHSTKTKEETRTSIIIKTSIITKTSKKDTDFEAQVILSTK